MSSSYAYTCAISPRSSGSNPEAGSTGTGTAPSDPITAGTSTTASSGRNGSEPAGAGWATGAGRRSGAAGDPARSRRVRDRRRQRLRGHRSLRAAGRPGRCRARVRGGGPRHRGGMRAADAVRPQPAPQRSRRRGGGDRRVAGERGPERAGASAHCPGPGPGAYRQAGSGGRPTRPRAGPGSQGCGPCPSAAGVVAPAAGCPVGAAAGDQGERAAGRHPADPSAAARQPTGRGRDAALHGAA